MTSVGFLASSICNSMAFWPIAEALLSGKWMDWSWLGLYALFESAAGIVMVVLFFYHQAPERGTFEAGYSTDVY